MVNPLAWIKAKIVGVVDALVPAGMATELGVLAHAFVANIQYDMKKIGLEGVALLQEEVAAVWTSVKMTLADVMKDPAFATLALTGQISAAVTLLVSDEAKNLIPALKNVGPVTIQNMVSSAGALLVSGVVDASQGQLQDPAAAAMMLVRNPKLAPVLAKAKAMHGIKA
jgi:hypothetical protein